MRGLALDNPYLPPRCGTRQATCRLWKGIVAGLLQGTSQSMGHPMNPSDINSIILSVVEKLPDLVRADLASRDLHVRQSAEATVAARIQAALEDLFAVA